MPVQLESVALDSHDPAALARFWASLLGRDVLGDRAGLLLAGTGAELGMRFVRARARKVGRDRTHFHLTSTDPDDQRRLVEMALGLGATHLDVGQLPTEKHIVLADPEGNELCVIEPGNSYLAGCGLLGEIACDGLRDVGVFWSEALGWPLVWDQDEETAIQSPRGGTKVAWGGPPLMTLHGTNRQQLHLLVVGDELQTEVARLISLGATAVDTTGTDLVTLADPGGEEFRLTVPA